jgi:hypothetical protein
MKVEMTITNGLPAKNRELPRVARIRPGLRPASRTILQFREPFSPPPTRMPPGKSQTVANELFNKLTK